MTERPQADSTTDRTSYAKRMFGRWRRSSARRARHKRRCRSQLVRDGGSYTVTDYCTAPKGHSGPCFSAWSRRAWVLDCGEVTYYGRSAVRVMRGGRWLPAEHLPSDPEAPPLVLNTTA